MVPLGWSPLGRCMARRPWHGAGRQFEIQPVLLGQPVVRLAGLGHQRHHRRGVGHGAGAQRQVRVLDRIDLVARASTAGYSVTTRSAALALRRFGSGLGWA